MNIRVGISGGWEPGIIVEGWPLVYTCKALVEKVEQSGAVPYVLPIVDDLSVIEKMLEGLDIIILAGEVLSIKQNVFDQHETNVLRASNPLRYDNEATLIKTAINLKMPILGICRGFQILAAELGGVVQDSDVNENNFIIHQQGKNFPPNKTVHGLVIYKKTRLHQFVNSEHVMVNSFHRQAVTQVPPGFKVSAISDDGVIEAMESEEGPLVLGVQFHPEAIPLAVWDLFFKNIFNSIYETKKRRS